MKEVKISKNGDIKEKSLFREIIDWIVCIVVAFVCAIVIKYFIFTPTLVQQTSMTPTILHNERVIINRVVRTFQLPIERGDIITFEKPDNTEKGLAVYDSRSGIIDYFVHNVLELTKTSYIKRVIGVGGDHVAIRNGNVYLNEELLKEDYLNGIKTPSQGDQFIYTDVIVPEGYLFVMGDNRVGSSDSRYFGCIPLSKVEGKVTLRVWPLSAFGKIDKD